MFHTLIRASALGATLLLATPALAFVDPPTFDPATPNSAQPITVNVRTGVCHYFVAPGDGIPPMRIERSPGVVDIIAPGIATFDPFCIASVGTVHFDIGTLSAGEYVVRIWMMDGTNNFTETIQLSNAQLTVTQGPVSAPIPTTGAVSAIVLTLIIFLFARRSIKGIS